MGLPANVHPSKSCRHWIDMPSSSSPCRPLWCWPVPTPRGRWTRLHAGVTPPGFVKVIDTQTLLIPDAPGNNRLDTLENILDTGQLGLLFMLPGFDETLRVNGQAVLSTEPSALQQCADARRTPVLVIRVRVQAVYLHCAKAFMRAQLWNPSRHAQRHLMPSMGEMLRDQIQSTQGHDMGVETQEEMMARYRQSL